MRGSGDNQSVSARTKKYRVLDESPDLKSKCCRRRLSGSPKE
jgi:hypothetical protein